MIKTLLKLFLIAVLALVLLGSCVAVFGGGNDRAADPPVTVSTPTVPDTPDAAPAPVIGIGAEARDGDFAFVVTDVRTGVETIGADYLRAEAQGSFTIVSVTVTNIGDRAQTFAGSSQKVLDAAGREFSADSTAGVYLPGSESFLTEVNPGNQVAGKVVFDLPAGTTGAVIELHDSPFSAGARVALA